MQVRSVDVLTASPCQILLQPEVASTQLRLGSGVDPPLLCTTLASHEIFRPVGGIELNSYYQLLTNIYNSQQ
eukprot:2485622-Amphidinium_carterae.1